MAYFGIEPYRPQMENETDEQYASFVARQTRHNNVVGIIVAALAGAILIAGTLAFLLL